MEEVILENYYCGGIPNSHFMMDNHLEHKAIHLTEELRLAVEGCGEKFDYFTTYYNVDFKSRTLYAIALIAPTDVVCMAHGWRARCKSVKCAQVNF